ncbi:protein FAM200B-like, partial [Aphis craccivora]
FVWSNLITLALKTIVNWENIKKSVGTLYKSYNLRCQEIENKLIHIFKIFNDKNHAFFELLKVVEFSFILPGSNAAVERVFSLMNSTWTNSRNKLDIKTVEATLIIKTCFNNKSCESVLKQIHGSANYVVKSTEETLNSLSSED